MHKYDSVKAQELNRSFCSLSGVVNHQNALPYASNKGVNMDAWLDIWDSRKSFLFPRGLRVKIKRYKTDESFHQMKQN